eukprot:scaffold17482_cov52-Attheya_sp.AAC.6
MEQGETTQIGDKARVRYRNVGKDKFRPQRLHGLGHGPSKALSHSTDQATWGLLIGSESLFSSTNATTMSRTAGVTRLCPSPVPIH